MRNNPKGLRCARNRVKNEEVVESEGQCGATRGFLKLIFSVASLFKTWLRSAVGLGEVPHALCLPGESHLLPTHPTRPTQSASEKSSSFVLCSLGNASQLPAPEALAIPVVVLLLAGDPRFDDDDDDDNSDRTGSSEDTCGAAAVLTFTAGRHPRCRGLNAVQEVTRLCRCASSSKPVSTPAARLPLARPVGD